MEVESRGGQPTRIVRAKSVVVATDVDAARRLLEEDPNGLLGSGSGCGSRRVGHDRGAFAGGF